MIKTLSLVGTYVLHGFGFAPQIEGNALIWTGVVFGFINFIALEAANSLEAPKFANVFKVAVGMAIVFGLIQLLALFSAQAAGLTMLSVAMTAMYMAAMTIFSGIGHSAAHMLFASKND